MGQILVRQLDDVAIERLKALARQRNTSLEALAREAILKAAELDADGKRTLAAEMRSRLVNATNPAMRQTPTVDLIREDRDR